MDEYVSGLQRRDYRSVKSWTELSKDEINLQKANGFLL